MNNTISEVGSARQRHKKASLLMCLVSLMICCSSNAEITNHGEIDSDELQSSGQLVLQQELSDEFKKEQDKLILSAYEGDREAQFRTAVMYTNKQFNEPDFEQAVYWYKQAARQGHLLAQYNLGHQYLVGQGVEKSEAQAMAWWLKAAKQNHALAQFNVGRGYYLGIGLERNLGASKYWFSQAALNKEPKSIAILKDIDWGDTIALPEETKNDSDVIAKESVPVVELQAAEQQANDISSEPRIEKTDQVLANAEIDAETDKDTLDADKQAAGQQTQDQAALLTSNTTTTKNTNTNKTKATDKTEKELDQQTSSKARVAKALLPVYTSPAIRSVLITLVEGIDSIQIEKESKEWLVVKSSTGLPVWLHGDYIKANTGNSSLGRVTGDNVNVRSVPIIAEGTKVGQLQKTDTVQIIEKQNDWYRVIAPTRLQAWVKKSDYKKASESIANQLEANQNKIVKEETKAAETKTTPAIQPITANSASQKISTVVNDNEWLFSQNKESFTLQLASFDDERKAESFIASDKFQGSNDLHQFTSLNNGTQLTYFLYGSFPNRQSAEKTKLSISETKAWVRQFKDIKQNRCISWKKQLPPPKELNKYCKK